jgi:hypothetical protein
MTNISRLEALVGAFAKMNGALDPLSKAYKLRNPLMLKAFSPKHEKDEDGYRVFNSLPSGWDNGVLDLRIKCSGGSHSRLKSDDTLENLVLCYGYPKTAATYIKKFLRHSLGDENIMEKTTLGWFLEDQKPAIDAVMTAGE